MTKSISIFLLLLVGFLVWLYFSKESGYTRERKRLIQERDSAIQRMNNEHARAEEWRQLAFDYGNQFRKEATRAQKAETNYNNARELNEILKRKVIRYSNAGLDSAFSARYGN